MQAPVQKSFTGQRATAGFTLIEVMITVAIVGILAAIALPNYTEYLMRGKLVEGHSQLAGHRVKMEQFFQDNRTYANACDPGSIAAKPADTEHFSFDCVSDATTYTVTANGKGTVTGFAFTINQSNGKATVVSSPASDKGWTSNAGCWIRKKPGQC